MTGLADWGKENAYYFFGPSNINRFFGTLLATLVGTLASYPLETVRTRLYLMKPLPNGKFPYDNAMDVIAKMAKYET
jgi:hypothetical protein